MADEPAGPGRAGARNGDGGRRARRTPTAFLQGGGELGALIRAKDWSRTPLGPPETWPQSLKTTLGILLNSRYPMFVFWGPELIKIYNDGYRPITGHKHPWALGRPAREVWPEIWSDIEPLVARALAGDPTYSDDLMLFMERSGFREEVYFTFSYSPVPDESGGVGGMFCACTETTARVHRRAAPADAARPRGLPRRCADRGRHLRAIDRRAGGEHRRRPLRADLPAATGRRRAPGRLDRGRRRRCRGARRGRRHRRDLADRPRGGDRHRRARHRPGRADRRRAGRTVARAAAGGDGAAARRSRPRPQRRRDRAGRQRAAPVRRRVPPLVRAARRPDQRPDRQRARRRGRSAAGRGAGRARSRQDHVLLEREPRVPHAAGAHAGAARAGPDRPTGCRPSPASTSRSRNGTASAC